MSVELTPRGSRGATVPKLPRPLMKVLFAIGNPLLRLRGAKLLELTTTGARSGLPRTVTLAWFPDGKDAWLVVASYRAAFCHRRRRPPQEAAGASRTAGSACRG